MESNNFWFKWFHLSVSCTLISVIIINRIWVELSRIACLKSGKIILFDFFTRFQLFPSVFHTRQISIYEFCLFSFIDSYSQPTNPAPRSVLRSRVLAKRFPTIRLPISRKLCLWSKLSLDLERQLAELDVRQASRRPVEFALGLLEILLRLFNQELHRFCFFLKENLR